MAAFQTFSPILTLSKESKIAMKRNKNYIMFISSMLITEFMDIASCTNLYTAYAQQSLSGR